MKHTIHTLLFALLFALVLATVAMSARMMLQFAAGLPPRTPNVQTAAPTLAPAPSMTAAPTPVVDAGARRNSNSRI